jgi:hypothetical protein
MAYCAFRYIEYWRQRFAKDGIDAIFPKVIPKEGDAHFGLLFSLVSSWCGTVSGKAEYLYVMSEQLPEDYSLRQRLAMRRLEEVRRQLLKLLLLFFMNENRCFPVDAWGKRNQYRLFP